MLPMYAPGEDPGPNFAEVARRAGLGPKDLPHPSTGAGDVRRATTGAVEVSHATTVVALRYAEGVVMAGDRRATSGNLISHRDMEKVFPADRHSGVAIAGAAGPAVEMVRLFQLQLEHYEKVEGHALSLEGKANQLSAMVRGHLPMAMQGFVVVPLFAGFDLRRDVGRLFDYDATGGRYEEAAYATTGSGSLFAGTVVKLGFREGMSREEAIDLALSALFQAADQDSATGGPDLIRRIFPIVATITAEGFHHVDEDEVATRSAAMVATLTSSTAGPGWGPAR
jgi:proteasome beta subunit